jgi:hypothetical protein
MKTQGSHYQHRQHLRANGEPKVVYKKRTAESVAAYRKLTAYRCEICKYWHVGNPS